MPVDYPKKGEKKDQHLVLFKRTDVNATHVIIYGHGMLAAGGGFLSCAGGASEAEPRAGSHLHFYIDDNRTFKLLPETFEKGFKGYYMPKYTFVHGQKAPNYHLTKAVGKHLKDGAGRVAGPTYQQLEQYVENSDKYPVYKAVADGAAGAFQLGNGVPCDIVSMAIRHVGKNTLQDVLSSPLLANYVHFHCYFCRAHSMESVISDPNPRK